MPIYPTSSCKAVPPPFRVTSSRECLPWLMRNHNFTITTIVWLYDTLATPKSPNLTSYSPLRNTFIVLISLCNILFLCKYSSAKAICRNSFQISYSDSRFGCLLIKSDRSPFEQYSIMMLSLLFSINES